MERGTVMILQHNNAAINSKRYFGNNKTKLNKNLEKLSSGYKINRAGDDAAGLAISESMRNKLKGLEQAENNAEDGISMIQTAEGALTEVHAMLERGTTLATQAANGTYTDEVRQHIDSEFQELKKEIDRISENTEFNGINLLNGLRAAGDIDTVASVKSSDEISDLEKKIQNIVGNTGEAILTRFSALNPNNTHAYPKTNVDISIKSLSGSTLANAGGTMASSGYIKVNIDVDKIDSINTATYESTLLHEMMHGVMGVAFSNAGTSLPQIEASDNLWFIEGTAQLSGGIFTAGWNQDIRSIAGDTASTDDQKVIYIKEMLARHGSPKDEVYGTGALMAAYIGYLASGSSGTISIGENGNATKILNGTNRILSEIIENGKSLEDAIYTTTGKTESELMSHFNGRNSNDNFVKFLINVANEAGTGGTGSVVNGLGSSLSQQSYYETYSPGHFVMSEVDTSKYGNGGGEVILQIGPSAEEIVKIYRFDMSSDGLGLTDSNVTTLSAANKAMGTLREAVENTSLTRAYFGAKQNRLEHTVNNLRVSNENTTAAESRIRDADMAKEFSEYTKNNILLQSSQAMLAQANQMPQSVLSLLS